MMSAGDETPITRALLEQALHQELAEAKEVIGIQNEEIAALKSTVKNLEEHGKILEERLKLVEHTTFYGHPQHK